MKYLVDEFSNIKIKYFNQVTVDIFYFEGIGVLYTLLFSRKLYSNLCIVEAAPKHGWRPQPQLLPHLQQALHERRDADGAHEVRAQGPQRVRRPR